MALVNPRQDGDKVCGDGGKAQRRRGELVGGGGWKGVGLTRDGPSTRRQFGRRETVTGAISGGHGTWLTGWEGAWGRCSSHGGDGEVGGGQAGIQISAGPDCSSGPGRVKG
jgi:hypothetical protein